MDAELHSWRRRMCADGEIVYSRPLGPTEMGFYWDALFNGTADIVTIDMVKIVDGSSSPERVFGKENILRAWRELKQRYPLLVARLVADERKEVVEFQVYEKDWRGGTRDIDLTFVDVGSATEAYDFGNSLTNGPRQLSDNLVARLYILYQTDDPTVYHVVFHLAHLITDGMGNAALRRILFDLIASVSARLPSFSLSLDNKLNMARSSDALEPNWRLSTPRRRWRRAIGRVVAERRQNVLQGGHTLPRRIDASTPITPAKSCEIHITIPSSVSSRFMATCRKNKFTFGHAHPVLGQIALARVLHRCRRRGQISDAEWLLRIRQPMHNGGPINLRPFLDKDWLMNGGESEAMMAISFFFHTLPHMPALHPKECEDDGTPPFSKLLSRERFYYRCKLIKKQADGYLHHPLFLEIASARLPGRIERVRNATLQWMEKEGTLTPDLAPVLQSISVSQSSTPTRPEAKMGDGLVITHGGSSMGNIDHIVPLNYPLAESHPLSCHQRVPRIQVNASAGADKPPTVLTILDACTLLHCRPAELYLGATTSHNMLYLNVFWDGNVYDSDLVKEWLGEVKSAALWYLSDGRSAEETAKL